MDYVSQVVVSCPVIVAGRSASSGIPFHELELSSSDWTCVRTV